MELSEKQSSAIAKKTGSEVVASASATQRKLERAFGAHTFFKSERGVFMVKPTTDPKRPGRALVRRVRLAAWADKAQTTLEALDASDGRKTIRL